MHYSLIIHDLRARARAAESGKNQIENELEKVQNQLNLALQREADISDIANNHERQIQFLSHSQEHVTCQGLTQEQFAMHAPNFARHIATDLKRIYRDMGGQPQE